MCEPDDGINDPSLREIETDAAVALPKEHQQRPRYILPVIVASQFAGTSLWFAGNAVLTDLADQWGLSESSQSYLTSAVQFGFIVGTLVFALLSVADRFRPTRVFMISSLLGALFNALAPFWESTGGLVFFRFLTGFSLAGIYPVGLKVAADWYEEGLGRALGWLVGALAVGSAFPFLLRQIPQPFEALLWETSALAATGGLVLGFVVPDGPYRKPGKQSWSRSTITSLFDNPEFRWAAFGYFGHMWELYAFWTWCPDVWKAYIARQTGNAAAWDADVITFAVLAIGGVGCVIGGLFSERYGSALVAWVSLFASGLFCFLSPGLFLAPPALTLAAFLIWGMAVAADSPQFSSLVAQTAPADSKGTALTIVTSIGFVITIGSIQLLGVPVSEQYLFIMLAPGPVFGLWSMRSLVLTKNRGEKQEEESSSRDINESLETA